MATRVKLTGLNRHTKRVEQAARSTLAGPVLRYIQWYLNDLLRRNQNPDGTKRPSSPPAGRKYPTTIKRYQKKGWDTDTYLVRTGDSTKLWHRLENGGFRLVVTPAKPRILGYHIPENKWRGPMEWMLLNPRAQAKITELFGKRLAKVK